MSKPALLEAQKELLSFAFSQAQAYTNVVLIGGYAGFFGIWTQMANGITQATKFWSGLLISLSIGGFIVWELYGMVSRSQSLMGIARAVNSPEKYEELISQHKVHEQARMIRLGRLWVCAIAFIASTGFSALGIMLSAFIHGLWLSYA